MSKIQNFINSITVPNTAKVVRFVLNGVPENIENYTVCELEQMILAMRPDSRKAIITQCYVYSLYAKWLLAEGLVADTVGKGIFETRKINKKVLWDRAKNTAKNKYLSSAHVKEIIHNVDLYEEFNSLYYKALFAAVYEGVYCEDMSVLKNLRGSDIDGNVLTLREDNGHTYQITVSRQLADELKELSEIDIWERRNGTGICKVKMSGLYYDSVFKKETRKTATDNSYRFVFYAKLRKISSEYIGHQVLPSQLYVSGLCGRIKENLERNGITMEEAFAENSRNKTAHEIISRELQRCNYTSSIGNFRDMVKGRETTFASAAA